MYKISEMCFNEFISFCLSTALITWHFFYCLCRTYFVFAILPSDINEYESLMSVSSANLQNSYKAHQIDVLAVKRYQNNDMYRK